MAAVNKIDGNITDLRYSKETSVGVADASAVWKIIELNSYADFGPQVTTVAREPIASDRQKRKGVLTDLDASGGYSADFTQEALPDLSQGVMYADMLVKDELAVTAVLGATDHFAVAANGTDYVASDLLFAQDFNDSVNNGLHEVSASTGTTVVVTTDLVEAAGDAGTIRRVGYKFAVGDLDVDTTGDFVSLTSTVKDFTDLSLIPGEWIFIGGDTAGAAGDQFTTAANNGFKRVRSVAAHIIVLDKSTTAMVTEADTTQFMKMFFAPRVIKNQSDPALQVRSTYQLERTLGAPDDNQPTFDHQREYLVGALPSQLQLNITQSDKMTYDMSFIATDVEQVAAGVGVKKAGTRPALVPSDAFNTSRDLSRLTMSQVSTTAEAATPLFAFIQEINLTIDNTVKVNKAVGVLGGFDHTVGTFAVSGALTAYMADLSAQTALRTNANITVDGHLVKGNQGFTFDLPLVTISDGRPDVQLNEAIMQPISFDAARGTPVDAAMDHTLLLAWWDYLPNAA